MAQFRLGVGGKVLVLVATLVLLSNFALLFVYFSGSRTLNYVEDASRMLNTLQKIDQVEREISTINYWMGDTALTWDPDSLQRVQNYQKNLSATLKGMQGAFPDFVTTIEEKMLKLSEITADAVGAYSLDDRDTGNKLIAQSRVINSEIQQAIVSLKELQNIQDENSFQTIISSIIDDVAGIRRISVLLILITTFTGATFGYIIKNSIAKPLVYFMSQIKSISRGTKSESQKISESSEKVAGSVASQAAAIQESVAAMTELRSMVTKTFEQATEADQSANSVMKVSEQGRAQMGELVSFTNQLELAIDSIDQSVESMKAESQGQLSIIVKIIEEIASKTKVINDIVFKTQLLSFNASIEAARAGQHGKGFAVVAHEVGNLARMSGAASKEIETLITNSEKQVHNILATIQQQVDSSQKQVGLGKQSSREVSESLSTANEVFSKILDDIDAITHKIQSVAEACDQQNRGLDQISVAMKDMQSTTENNNIIADQNFQTAKNIRIQSEKLTKLESRMSQVIYGDFGQKSPLSAGVKKKKTHEYEIDSEAIDQSNESANFSEENPKPKKDVFSQVMKRVVKHSQDELKSQSETDPDDINNKQAS